MKAIITLLNKCNQKRRQISCFNDIQDGIVFCQILDDLYNQKIQQSIWKQIITCVQILRQNNQQRIQEFDEDLCLNNSEITNFIRYFIDTLLQLPFGKEMVVEFMKSLSNEQQQDIIKFLDYKFDDQNEQLNYSISENQTTNTIILLEENLDNKEQQIKQFELTIEQMNKEHFLYIQNLDEQINQQTEYIDKQAEMQQDFLNFICCSDLNEAKEKFLFFQNEIHTNKQTMDSQNTILQIQQNEITKLKSKYQQSKSQLTELQSNPNTYRGNEKEQIFVKDPQDLKLIDQLKQQISTLKEDNSKLLELRQSQYQSEIIKLQKKLSIVESELHHFKKKFEKKKVELEELNQETKECDKKNNYQNLKIQGIYSSNNSFIGEDQKANNIFSPKSSNIDFQEKSTFKFDQDSTSGYKLDEETVAKYQKQINERNSKIALLEQQVQQLQLSSTRNQLGRFGTQERQQLSYDCNTLLENLKYQIQLSEQKEEEIQQLKEKSNTNFVKLSELLLKQNDQIRLLNSLIIQPQQEMKLQLTEEFYQNELQKLSNYYLDQLSQKDELLLLLKELIYDQFN